MVLAACSKKEDPNAPLKSLVGTEWSRNESEYGDPGFNISLRFIDNDQVIEMTKLDAHSEDEAKKNSYKYTYNKKTGMGEITTTAKYAIPLRKFEVTDKVLTVKFESVHYIYKRVK